MTKTEELRVVHGDTQSHLEWLSVSVPQLGAVWSRLVPMIERGLSHGQGDNTTVDHMLFSLVKGRTNLWVAMEGDNLLAGVILSVKTTDAGRKLWIDMLAGGERWKWADQLESLVAEYAKLTGSNCIECSCRPGLARILKRRGWRQKAIVMELT